MNKLCCVLSTFFLLSCQTTTYFIVRHAEKETVTTMTQDVPLSAAGKERAEALKTILLPQHIDHIYSTNTLRTTGTAMPLSGTIGLMIETYDPRDNSFVTRLKKINKGNVLVVGHSNTVDDMVNSLTGEIKIKSDLPDSQYGDLFIVKRKGKNYRFETKHFGK